MVRHRLDPLLNPRSIALVGASGRQGSPGHTLVDMVINAGFTGAVYPVNPRYDTLLGLPCYRSLDALPETVEHAVLAVADERLETVLAQAIDHGVKAVTIYASCYLAHDSAPSLQQRLTAMAKAADIVICGGNGMGFYNLTHGLHAGVFPKPDRIPKGGVSYIAQSGSAFTTYVHNGRHIRFNLCVSSGNELVTTVADYMDWCLEQDETDVIALFLETVRDPVAFVTALDKAVQNRIPVIVLKIGKTPLSMEMATTHTGAIAGNHDVLQALFRRYGVIEVNDLDEMAATLTLFQSARRAGPGSLATIHESGGFRELMVDLADELEIGFANIETSTKQAIQQHLDPGLKAENPLDAWGTNDNFESRFQACLSALVKDCHVSVGAFFANFRDGYYLSEGFYRVMKHTLNESGKPIAMINCYSGTMNHELSRQCGDIGLPFIDGVKEGLLAIRHLFRYRDFCHQQGRQVASLPRCTQAVTKWRARLSVSDVVTLSESTAMKLLCDFAIPTPAHAVIGSEDELRAAASKIGFPLVLKTAETGIAHKSDQGGVFVNITDVSELTWHYRDLRHRIGPQALVSKCMDSGIEIGLGVINDPQFGPFVMVAAGGVLIEIIDDHALAQAPVSRIEAQHMVETLKVNRLLEGVRGEPARNKEALIDVIVSLSEMAYHLRHDVAEIDLNPVIVTESAAIVVDALVVRRPSAPTMAADFALSRGADDSQSSRS